MNEWWSYFKEIPVSVKIKYFIALPIGVVLFLICRAGELAEILSGVIGDWVRSGMRR
jgi:hypothetical protein